MDRKPQGQRSTLSEATAATSDLVKDRSSPVQSTAVNKNVPHTLVRNVSGKSKNVSGEKRNFRARKRANVLRFRFHCGRSRHVQILLRSKRLSAALSTKDVTVTDAKFRHVRLLPNRVRVVTAFSVSLARLNHRNKSHSAVVSRQLPLTTDVLETSCSPDCSRWLEMERTSLSERKSSLSSSVHQLQMKLTEELNSAASSNVRHAGEKSDNDLPLNVSHVESATGNDVTVDDIDDIFGVLDR